MCKFIKTKQIIGLIGKDVEVRFGSSGFGISIPQKIKIK